MFSTKETIRALVSAFNIHNYARDTVETNFTLQSRGKKDYIVVLFDEDMNGYQCSRYLDGIKRKIIREFYGIEEDNDKEILDTAALIFNVKSFPFDLSKGKLSSDKHGRVEFVTPVDSGVIFNLKSHLASSLEKDVLEDMQVSSKTLPFDKKKYLCRSKFPNKELCKQFEHEFLARMKERYENIPDELLKVEGNDVYIRNAFDDAHFIDSIARYAAWLTGMGLQADSKERSDVKAFKDLIMQFIDQSTGVVISAFLCASPLSREEASILIPVVRDNKMARLLTKEEARAINCTFSDAVCNDLSGQTQAELLVNGNNRIYGIDFSDPWISYCVITKIIENSVINKNHELTIDPELFARSLSQSPSTDMSDAELESPQHNQEKQIRESPRQPEKEKGTEVLYHTIDSGNLPQQSLSAAAVGAGASVQGDSIWLQQKDPWLSQGTHEDKWLQSLAVDADRSSRSGECSKAKSEEDRAESKSPKKQHRGGVRCKQWWSKMSPKRFFNQDDNKPISRGDEGRYSTKSAPGGTANEKQPDPKQHNTFPTRKGNLSSVPSPIRLKEGCSLEFPYLKYELVDGSTYVPKLTQEDIVEGKRRILYEFISYLPFKIDKEPEKKERLTSISSCSHKEIENLYFSFSSPDKRERLCPKLPFYHDKNKCQVESLWKEAHQSYAEKLSMLKVSERLKQSSGLVQNEPGCRDSIASKSSEASKDSAYFTGSPASQRSSTSNILGSSYEGESLHSFPSCTSFLSEPSTSGSVLRGTSRYNPDSSDEDKFSDKSLRHGSSVSGLSTSSSVLRDTSKCSSDSSDEDKFFRRPSEYISRINKSPTGSSISSNKSSETIVEHDTENKGAFRENSPSSQVGLIQLLRAKPSAEHRKFLENLKQQHAKGKNRIDRILGLGKMGLSETRGGVHSRFS